MKIAVLKEQDKKETRVPLIPESIKKLKTNENIEITVEAGIGKSINISDDDYKNAGANIEEDRDALIKNADFILKIRKPALEEIELMKDGAIYASFLDVFNEKELVMALKNKGVTSISMEMIPRTTLAQKMDALSSQASIAGYVAVLLATEKLNKMFPMMMTPAGTISPSKVFVIGAGVAGLQAIATAKRLGARVEAFDTRPVVQEQVESLGAKFIKVDLGETGQTSGGYANQLSPEQLEKQREAMAKTCAGADVVITTAKLFGRKAPIIITKEMIKGMKPGSVIIDLAAETGGNVEGCVVDKTIKINEVNIVGYSNLEGRVPVHSSQMFSSNLTALITELWNKKNNKIDLDFSNEIIDGCVITYNKEIRNKKIKLICEGE